MICKNRGKYFFEHFLSIFDVFSLAQKKGKTDDLRLFFLFLCTTERCSVDATGERNSVPLYVSAKSSNASSLSNCHFLNSHCTRRCATLKHSH